MNKDSLVSIILPVYNCEHYLKRCLDSLINQTYPMIEIILIDDGSSDGSGQICDDYCESDNRIRVLHYSNGGVTKARKSGVDVARGHYILFVDADDYLDSTCVETLLINSEDRTIDIVVCSHYIVQNGSFQQRDVLSVGRFEKAQINDIISKNLLFDTRLSAAGIPLYLWGKLLKTDLVKDCIDRGNGFWYGEDLIAYIAMVKQANSMKVIDKPLYYYVCHDQQATSKSLSQLWPAYIKLWTEIDITDEEKYFVDQLPKRIWSVYWGSVFSAFKKLNIGPFIQMMREMRDETIISEKIFNNNRLSFTPKLLFYLLKYRLFILLYFAFLIKKGK